MRIAQSTVLAMLFAAASQAVTIDSFTDTETGSPTIIPRTALGSDTVFDDLVTGVIGGQRITTVTASVLDQPGVDIVQGGIFPMAGVFDYSSSAGATGEARLTYRNTDGVDGLDANLSGDAFVRIDVTHFNFASTIPMAVELILDDGTDSASLTKQLVTAGPQQLDFLFSQFPAGDFANLDLTDIDRIDVIFSAGQSTDFRISSIISVPEPASLTLMLIGSLTMLRRTNRR